MAPERFFLAVADISNPPDYPTWPFGVAGIVAVILGVLFIAIPKKSGRVLWRINQALRTRRIKQGPVAAAVLFGFLALLVGVVLIVVGWHLDS